MATTRERALDAAVELIGTQGLRALTHARVDERAGLPRGSTSNSFRTRSALLGGVVSWVAQREMADFRPDFDPATVGIEGLIDGLCALIEVQAGPFRNRTIARYTLFLEGANDAELLEPLLQNRHEFEAWVTTLLAAIGASDAAAAARTAMAGADGVLLHRITVDPNSDIRGSIATIVRACVGAPVAPASA